MSVSSFPKWFSCNVRVRSLGPAWPGKWGQGTRREFPLGIPGQTLLNHLGLKFISLERGRGDP